MLLCLCGLSLVFPHLQKKNVTVVGLMAQNCPLGVNEHVAVCVHGALRWCSVCMRGALQ